VLTRLSVLACVFAVATTSRAAEPQANLVRATYQVADLVTPPPADAARHSSKAKTTPEERLIHHIKRAVQPTSWNDNGGPGTIEYFAPSMALVVNQTPVVQKHIGKLLARLRKDHDTEVSLEVRVMSVSEECLSQRATSIAANPKDCQCLSAADLSLFLEAVSGDMGTNVMSAPKLTLGNHQTSTLKIPHEGSAPALCLTAHPVVSADRRYVKLALNVEATDAEEKAGTKQTVTVPDGGTVLLGGLHRTAEVRRERGVPVLSSIPYVGDLFRCVGTVREPRHVLVLVTPRVVVPEEAEEKVEPTQTDAKPQVVPLADQPWEAPVAPEASSRQAKVLADILRAYDAACEEGRGDEAEKLACAALVLDPTCFHRKR
jgi:Bacterial type II and III secretion system protein